MVSTSYRLEDDNGSEQCTSVNETNDSPRVEGVAQQRTPLPVKQVFVLCLMRFAEPISFSVIFPFVNQMIEELGVTSDPKELGYYSGFIEGVFALAQFCTVCFWGSLSDRIGRRPILISGLCGVVGSTIMFGMSKSFTMMLISRALSGALNGNVAVIKSVLGEITDETNQGIAFAYLPLCWSIGSLLAPALGGFLSHPAERYPSVFGCELFRHYPYLLPCLAGSAFSIIGLIAGILFLEETLPKDKTPTAGDAERRPLLASNSRNYSGSYSTSHTHSVPNPRLPSPDICGSRLDGAEKHAPSVKEIMRITSIRKILISYGFMAYVTVSINAILILWLYTPVKSGGIGFSTAEIGTTLTLSGIFGTVVAVVVFPPLERRVGAVFLYRVGMIMQVLNVLTFPLGHAFALSGGMKGAYFGAALVLVVRCIAGMVFVCNMLLVTRSAPCRRSLGTVNGLAQMVASASRAIGPATATSLFAFSVKNNALGGNLVWLVLSLMALLGVVAACQIPKDRPLDAESSR
ncbi:major facilitator superfamily domain-containing protein [Rhizoctonia solani]|nr:major facilitator superfamily domain-containing protein [Rhizoctonia solani]